MTSTPDSRNFLDGDFFINAFNSGKFPVNETPSHPDEDTNIPHSNTVVSSSEDTTSAGQGQTPGSGVGRSSSGPKLNPRSCVTCRKRKVRCNKHEPCSNCVKANIDCIFPPPGRAPRKPRRPHDAELLKRLRRLESVVDSLGRQVDEDGNVHHVEQPSERRNTADSIDIGDLSPSATSRRTSLEYGLGRLLIKEGKSCYVSNDFLSSLGDEIAEIRNVLDDSSSDDEDDPITREDANDQDEFANHQGFIFGYSSLMYDMTKLHPSPSQIFIIWEIFKENVDPVLKILHVPTVKNVIMTAAVSAASLSKASEAVFYSICFAAVVSMSEDQAKQLLGDEKNKLMRKYRFATEQALARAQFLNSSSLLVLQAFVMFLTVVKYLDTTRSIWALCGMAMQQAQAQGLHRDGSNFNLRPFDTEMRRRLWWHISVQDARAAEDYGADPRFNDHAFDTRMPLNVNDEDIWPDMTEAPHEQQGASDMTFCLIRFEMAHIQRKLRILASMENDEGKKRTIKEKEHLIDVTYQHMQEKYFVHCDPNSPFLWVASTVGKLILAKTWLYVHHPRLYSEDTQANHDLKDQVFVTCVEVVEFGILLERGKNTAKWAWLFKTYMQWHAVVYVLSELFHRNPGPEFDRAWRAIDAVYERRMLDHHKTQKGVLWRPLKLLYARAKSRREQLTGQPATASPHSNPDSNRSLNSDSHGALTPMNGVVSDNWLGANPYTNAVSISGADFGLDFNDPAFNEVNLRGIWNLGDTSVGNDQIPSAARIAGVPFGWTPEVGDYITGFGPQDQQAPWQLQVQQEWQ